MRPPKKDPDIEARLNFGKFREVITTSLEERLLKPLRWRPVNEHYYGTFSKNFENAALLALKVDEDLEKAKQYFYFSELSKVRQYLEYANGAKSIMRGEMPNFFKTPLSGNPHLYAFYSKMQLPEMNIEKKSDLINMMHLFVRMQQAAIVKDLTRLANAVNAFEKVCFCEPKLDHTPVIQFYRGLIDRQADTVEEAIITLLSPERLWIRQKGYRQVFPGKFMAKETQWLAKIAWINGYEIDIDHPLIISELLPDTPSTVDVNTPSFLIDPGLGDYDFWHYGGEHTDVEVEQHNQAIFNTRIPDKYKGVSEFVDLSND